MVTMKNDHQKRKPVKLNLPSFQKMTYFENNCPIFSEFQIQTTNDYFHPDQLQTYIDVRY